MAKVKLIHVESAMSAEINKTWHRFAFSMDVEIEDGDVLSDVKEKSWNTVHDEIEKQIRSLI